MSIDSNTVLTRDQRRANMRALLKWNELQANFESRRREWRYREDWLYNRRANKDDVAPVEFGNLWSSEPTPPLVFLYGDDQGPCRDFAFSDSALSPDEPHSLEIEAAFRSGLHDGAKMCVPLDLASLLDLRRDLEQQRSDLRAVKPSCTAADGVIDVSEAKKQAYTRGKHLAVAFAVEAVFYADDRYGWGEDDDPDLTVALLDWLFSVRDWKEECISVSDQFFDPPPKPFQFIDHRNCELDQSLDEAIDLAISQIKSYGGFIADVIDHNLSTAKKPQPIFAVGSALALTGALIGRKYRDEYGTRSNVQIISVGETTCGKDHGRQINDQILAESGNEAIISAEEVTSDTAIYRMLAVHPVRLFQADEFGRFLKTTQSASTPWLYNVCSALMKLFTSAGRSRFIAKSYAASDDIVINQPCLILHGTSTPHAIFEALGSASVNDGLLGRCLVLESKLQPRRKMVGEKPMPASILRVAEFWRDCVPGDLATEYPQPVVVPTTDEAMRIFELLDAVAHEQLLSKRRGCALWGRVEQKARQLALILACSMNHEDPLIDYRAARLGCLIAMAATRHMVSIASDWLSSNGQEATTKRLYRVIKDHPDGLTKSQLTRKSQWLKRRERDDILGSLIEAGQVWVDTTKSPIVHRAR